MAGYHGDVMYKIGTLNPQRDERDYPVAIVLLLLFGGIGAHRFYLKDYTIALTYLVSVITGLMVTLESQDLTFVYWESIVVSVCLFFELLYFIYKWATR